MKVILELRVCSQNKRTMFQKYIFPLVCFILRCWIKTKTACAIKSIQSVTWNERRWMYTQLELWNNTLNLFSIELVLNPSLSCYSIVLLCNNGHFEREDLVRIHTFPLESLYLSMVSTFLLHVVLGWSHQCVINKCWTNLTRVSIPFKLVNNQIIEMTSASCLSDWY